MKLEAFDEITSFYLFHLRLTFYLKKIYKNVNVKAIFLRAYEKILTEECFKSNLYILFLDLKWFTVLSIIYYFVFIESLSEEHKE